MSRRATHPSRRPSRAALIGIAAALIASGPALAAAQVPSRRAASSIRPQTNGAAEAFLKTAAAHARDGQWDAAIELYERVVRQYPEAMTALDDAAPADAGDAAEGVTLFVNLGDYAQHQIARMPAEALEVYRDRVDGEARHHYEEGRARLDPASLRRVVDSFFCSSYGDQATELLADLAFQEGRFDEASLLYRRLLDDPRGDPAELRYPDPDVDVARVAAKEFLCRAARGEAPGADDLRRFAESYPGAEGRLAGRDGPYAEILARALRTDALEPSATSDARWPTFAGDPTRSKVAPEPIDLGPLVWSAPLHSARDVTDGLTSSPLRFRPDFGLPEDDSPCFFPVLADDEVLVTDGRRVTSYALGGDRDRSVGAARSVWSGGTRRELVSSRRTTIGIERHTLTVHGDRIYARVGPFGVNYEARNNGTPPPTSIVALRRSGRGAPLWTCEPRQVFAAGRGDALFADAVAFGGSPVADDEGVYVAMVKPGTQALTWVACIDPATGRPRWLRYICSAPAPAFDRGGGFRNRGVLFEPDLGHRLLTLSGSTLYYQTDLGVLASIDARSGRLKWLATYPRVLDDTSDPLEAVGHNPAVVDGDLVVIAPEDSDRVFAYDRATGRLAWQADPGSEVEHLLGVASGRVVVTGDYVWTIDAEDGAVRSQWPEGPMLERGYGRGLLAGDEIYWPTRSDKVYILDQATGLPADRPPIDLRARYNCGAGNLVAGDGYLVLAERDRLHVFCKDARMLRRLRERIEEEPDEPDHYYRLARIAESLGDHEQALEGLGSAIERARPSDRIDGRLLIPLAMAERYRIVSELARRAADEGRPAEAAERYAVAAGAAVDSRDHLEALIARAGALSEAGDAAEAVDVLQGILRQPDLRAISVAADDHRTVRAELLVVDRLRAIVASDGREPYRRYDAEAERLLRRGIVEEDPRLLREVARSYPVAASAPEALRTLGDLLAVEGDWDGASRAYQRLVASADDESMRSVGLRGLARSFEALGLEDSARDARSLAASLYSRDDPGEDDPWGGGGDEPTVEPPPDSAVGPDEAGPAPPPLMRIAERRWPDGSALLPRPDRRATAEGPLLLLRAGRLTAMVGDGEAPLWTTELELPVAWSGIIGETAVIGDGRSLVGIDLETGNPRWRFEPEEGAEPILGRPAAAVEAGRPPDAGAGAGRFDHFTVRADRLFFIRDSRDLVCFDADAGRPDWVYRAGSASINPRLGFGPTRVVVQLREPNAVAVLDVHDGRTLGHFAQDESAGLWRRAPFAVSVDLFALVTGAETVELFDIGAGRSVWRADEGSPLPDAPRPMPGDPRILGDAGRLLILRGDRLERVDPADGDLLWAADLERVGSGDRAEPVALGHDALYYVGSTGLGRTLGAVDLETGEHRWSESLGGDPGEAWGVGLTADCAVAYRLNGGSGDDGYVVLTVLRRDSGRRVQRILVAASEASRRVSVGRSGVLVASASGLCSLDGAADAGRRIER